MKTEKHTPLMQQYFDIKEQYPDSLLFFQVGDFYELFFDDATTASSFLAITLTKRGKNKGQDIPLCGIPVHALSHYLRKLIKGGFKVALCDQLSKPVPGTVVERGVTQVFTPGTLTDSLMLDEKSASYLLTVYPTTDHYGLLFSELMTAQLFATVIPADNKRSIESELSRFFPDEILLPHTTFGKQQATYFKHLGYCTSFAQYPAHEGDEDSSEAASATTWLKKQFPSSTYTTVTQQEPLLRSLSLFHAYLEKNNPQALSQFASIQFYEPDDYLILDRATQKNLEIIANNQDGTRKNSLVSILDKARTAMGSRTIKKWLLRPLVNREAIMQRQAVITSLTAQLSILQQLEEQVCQLADLERIIGRIALRRALINDYRALHQSLSLLPTIKQLLSTIPTTLSTLLQERLIDFTPLIHLLTSSINDDAGSPHLIKRGFDHELDHLRNLAEDGQAAINALEQEEIKRTGITTLKIRFNSISGYSIEVTESNLSKIPSDYIHRQKLTNRQRFTTPTLTKLEQDITRAHHEMSAVEQAVFERVKAEVETMLTPLRHTAQALAYLDGLIGFARIGYDNRYVAPVFHETRDISIVKGRHPVIETTHQPFIGNDTYLTDEQALLIITGPNMGGKSTYLRQTALICLMAQCGSLVPAEQAHLPILDRIFTRIGSADNLAEGKSTFLVEMEETATICTQATGQSLVILDEVGRGTSTFDGIALAQAIIEYLVTTVQARCLFATHYHELTTLSTQYPMIKNYHLACKKDGNTLHFLHTILPGIADGSFGLDVARLAQLPPLIINRATTILEQLENQHSDQPLQHSTSTHHICNKKDSLTINKSAESEFITVLNSIKLNETSPKQALDLLWKLVEKAQDLSKT